MSRVLFAFAAFVCFSTISGEDKLSAGRPLPPVEFSPPVVRTDNGAIRGRIVRAANDLYAQEFLGIPYAQPPVGALRFRAPQPVGNWQGERDGTRLGNACWQSEGELTQYFTHTLFQLDPDRSTLGEDCLTINVHAPYNNPTASNSQNSRSLLPVFVWIHGGGFQWGSNNIPLYNASILATEINVVVAVINYRLGAFGFLTLNNVDGVSGNQGLLDQALAIKWIHENARHFGGNPEQITLTGESSGAASVQYHTLSPLSRNLFARSIMQSGSATSYWAYHTPAKARQWSRAYVALAGCSESDDDQNMFKCFESLSAQQIIDTFNHIRQGAEVRVLVPTTDGVFLTKTPSEHLQTGDFKRAPAVVGTVAAESLCWYDAYLSTSNSSEKGLTKAAYDSMMERVLFFADDTARNAVNFAYRNWPVSPVAHNDDLASRMERLRMLIAVSDDIDMNNGLMETLDAYLNANVSIYRYRFDEISSVPMWNNRTYSAAVHNDQLPFMLGHVLDPKFGYPQREVEFARKLLRAISSFIRTGDPNASGSNNSVTNGPIWKPYSGQMEYFTLDSFRYGQINTGPERWQVDFWRQAAPYFVNIEESGHQDTTHKASDQICVSKLIAHIISLGFLLQIGLLIFLQFRTTKRKSDVAEGVYV